MDDFITLTPYIPTTTVSLLPEVFGMSGQNTVTACLKQSFRQLLKKGWTWGSGRVKKMPSHTLGSDVSDRPWLARLGTPCSC